VRWKGNLGFDKMPFLYPGGGDRGGGREKGEERAKEKRLGKRTGCVRCTHGRKGDAGGKAQKEGSKGTGFKDKAILSCPVQTLKSSSMEKGRGGEGTKRRSRVWKER